MRVYYMRYRTPFLSTSPCDVAGAGHTFYTIAVACMAYLVVTADMTTIGSAVQERRMRMLV
jgi:hypothetical protein